MVVVVAVGAGGPSSELRALLEGGIGVTEEFGFGNTHLLERRSQRRPGALAHTDNGNIGRFDQRHRKARLHPPLMTRRNDARGQPSGGAAADDHDLLNGLGHAQLSHERATVAVALAAGGRLKKAALFSAPMLELGVYPERELPAGVDHVQDLL